MASESVRTQTGSSRSSGRGGGDWLTASQAVPLEIGPFLSHSDLLRFASQLEAQAGIQQIELIHAGPRTGRFLVHATSPAIVARSIAELSGMRISAVVLDNTVSAHVHDSSPRAMQVFAPPTAARSRRFGVLPVWFSNAFMAIALLALIPLAVGLAVFFVSTDGGGQTSSSGLSVAVPPVGTPLAQTSPAPVVVIPPPVTPTEEPAAAATPDLVDSASPTPEPTVAEPTVEPEPEPTTVAPTPEPTSVSAVEPQPVVPSAPPTDTYRATFSGTFGVVTAVNGCRWDTPFQATVDMPLTRSADGRLSGNATTTATLRYVVVTVPPATTCNPGTSTITANGPAGESGSRFVSTMFGERQFEVNFNGNVSGSGNSITGSVAIRRMITTTSPFGDTNELRNTSISNVQFARVN